MKPDWMSDARQIPDEVMTYLRQIAVCAVLEKNFHPAEVSDMLGISLSAIYDWLNRFKIDGYQGLETRKAPGMRPVITKAMDEWLKKTVLDSTPDDHGFDTPLWTCDILAVLLKCYFGIDVIGATVNQHLKKLDLSCQKPNYCANEQNPDEVKRFLDYKYPRIQRLAAVMGAEIGFEDEAGIDLRERSGRTWGAIGKAPKVRVTGQRGRFNVLSVVTATGRLNYKLTQQIINSRCYVDYLAYLIKGRERPLFLIVDRAAFHQAKEVRRFVCKHRKQLRIYFLPSYSPELNPDEHVWEEIKDKKLGRQVVQNKFDLKQKLQSALQSLQDNTARVKSFFSLPETKYAIQ